MEALGRLFNVVPAAGGEVIDLKDAEGITFICTAAATNSTVTLVSSASEDASSPSNVQVTRHHKNVENDGTAAWTLVEHAANHVVTPGTGAGTVVAIHVPVARLADGHRYIRATGTTTTGVIAILHDLVVQGDPAGLPALVASG